MTRSREVEGSWDWGDVSPLTRVMVIAFGDNSSLFGRSIPFAQFVEDSRSTLKFAEKDIKKGLLMGGLEGMRSAVMVRIGIVDPNQTRSSVAEIGRLAGDTVHTTALANEMATIITSEEDSRRVHAVVGLRLLSEMAIDRLADQVQDPATQN